MKTESVHIRLPQEERKLLAKMAENYGLSATGLAAILLKAAIVAVKDRRVLPLPIEFKVNDQGFRVEKAA